MSKEPSGEIILYQRDDAPAIDVRLDGETVWMSQKVICPDFRQVDSRPIGSDSVVADFASTAIVKKTLLGNPTTFQTFAQKRESP
jgi:hypothetical protein